MKHSDISRVADEDRAASSLAYNLRIFNRRWFNFAQLRFRAFDGQIATMQQSGSHWVKNLLSSLLIQRYGLPPLRHVQDDSIIGHPKSPTVYKDIPSIVMSHGMPHALTLKLGFLHYPKYLVLVRDVRDSLVSHYERFKKDYNVSFSTYLHCPLGGKRYNSDIYTRISFMNEWGRVMESCPERVMYVRYEDLKANPAQELREMSDYFGFDGITDEMIQRAVETTTKEKMAKKPNPAVSTTVIRLGDVKPTDDYFPPKDQRYFDDLCRRFLKYDFGYGYPKTPSAL